MTNEHQALAADLLQRAVDGTDEPSRAASLLVTAAATILQRHFGQERAIEMLHHGLDVAGADLRAAHAH